MRNEIATIPEYTVEDFYSSSAPYDFLYSFAGDKFLLGQMRERLKAKAAALGVKGFIGLWNAYMETKNRENGIKLDNATSFDGQEIELFSGQYICDESGVFTTDKHGYEVNVCRHPIMPVERLINVDNGEERLKIAFKKGKAWRYVIVEKSAIASSNSILQLAAHGIIVNSENAKPLSTYLLEIEQLNYDIIPEERSVGRLGWVGEKEFSPFVGSLTFDGEANFRHIFNSVHSAGDFETWVNIMRDVRKEKGLGRVFLAAAFASAILEPCGLLPFIVHSWGGSGTGKTVGLMIATSVWASPKMGDYIATFNSTYVGHEMLASFLNSLPMCIDELQIQSTAGVKDFDRLIYQITEGVGKTRGAKTGGLQKQNTWRNCIITTGEHPISNASSAGGAINRIIEFECDSKIYENLPYLCSVISKNYGFAGQMFVDWIKDPENEAAMIEIQKSYYRELLKANSTEKQAASASALLTADLLVTNLIFRDNANLTIEDLSSIMSNKEDVEINERAMEYIVEMIERNINHFRPNSFGEYNTEVWGKLESGSAYIIKSVFDRELAAAGFNSGAFLSWAKRNGRIISDGGRRTKKARIINAVTNCVCLILS